MKRSIVAFAVVFTAIIVVMAFAGYFVIRRVYQTEILTVQNIAGAVLSAYPEAENQLITAVQDGEKRDAETGAEILAQYGYDLDRELSNDPVYSRILKGFFGILAVLLLGGGLCGAAFFATMFRRKRIQERQMLSLLDDCLSGEYGFIKDEKRLEALQNPLFSDTLVKLAKNLQLKTESLAQERDHTKTLVTDISHQLKTPISALKTCFSMYIEAENEEERQEFLDRCRMQMEKLETLTASLIQISRLEYQMIVLHPSPVSLMEILIDAVNTVYEKAQEKEIRIVTDDFEDLRLSLDQKWTVEAIANILDNAVKYSSAGQTVFLRVQKLYSFVRIEIEDSGIGICREEQNQIFQRFYRGKSEAVQREEGSGVGLYLSRKILEDEGGTLSVRSAREKGSIFIVQLPL